MSTDTISRVKPERPISEPVGRRILTSDQIDDLGEAILTLTKEVWVLTDRQHILESILEKKGVVVADEIERFVVDAKMQAELNAKRDRLVDSVLWAMKVGSRP